MLLGVDHDTACRRDHGIGRGHIDTRRFILTSTGVRQLALGA
jgi:hypothetical protein